MYAMPRLRAIGLAILALWGGGGGAGGAARGDVVYSSRFSEGAGPEWSARNVEVTPKGNRHFLGPFTTQKITLSLKDLPAHKYLRISADLFIIMTWDGNGTTSPTGSRIGPDYWRMGVEGGLELVNASFSNMDFVGGTITREARTQSFPSLLTGEQFPAKTGAAESNTLGYEWTFSNGMTQSVDSVYRMSFIIRHDAPALRLNFAGGEFLQPQDDECWGLEAVKVEALDEDEVKRLDEAGIRRLWEAVGGRDPGAEADAFWRLSLGGDEVVRFLRGQVKPPDVDRRRVQELIRRLDGDDFHAREDATDALKEMGTRIEGTLRREMDRAQSAEQRLRIQGVLLGLSRGAPADPEDRRRAIAMRLLGVIDTPAARKAAGELGGK